MENNTRTRVLQHLLVQDFTLYTTEAAVCMVLQGSLTLYALDHAWAVEMDPLSWSHIDRLIDLESTPLIVQLRGAAETCRTQQTMGALMHTQGAWLLMPLDVASVRGARMRIEEAVIRGLQPPTDKLQAFGDEQLLQEARRRKLVVKALQD
jgi:hypothetical protein